MLFDHKGLIKRYETPEQILEEFFHLRIDFYERRRRLLLQVSHTKPVRRLHMVVALHDSPGRDCTALHRCGSLLMRGVCFADG